MRDKSVWNGLKRNKRPNKYSLKMINQLNGEVQARIDLCHRANGTPKLYNEVFKRNDGRVYTIQRVRCVNGVCECRKIDKKNNCGGLRGNLEPHETPRRSKGKHIKVSLKYSIMVLRDCHRRLDSRQPKLQWIKEQL